MNAYSAYSIVAGVNALASLLIAFGVVRTLTQITDAGMWAIAGMTAVPALMAMGVCYFINSTHGAALGRESVRRLPPDDTYGSGAFISKER